MSEQPTELTETVDPTQENTTEEQQPKPTETVDFWKSKAREQEKRAKDNAKAAERLAEIEQSSMTEAQKLTQRAEQAESRLPTLESENNRLRAAISAGLTDPDLVDRIRGDSLEAMVEDAKGLAARLAPQQRPTTAFAHGARQSAQPESMNALIRQAAGRA